MPSAWYFAFFGANESGNWVQSPDRSRANDSLIRMPFGSLRPLDQPASTIPMTSAATALIPVSVPKTANPAVVRARACR